MTEPAVFMDAATLGDSVRQVLRDGGRPIMAYAWSPAPDRIELRYVVAPRPGAPFAIWATRPIDNEAPSLADDCPLLSWYEREITDLFGVTFSGQPEPSRLVLHQGVDTPSPPMSAAFPVDLKLSLTENVGGMPAVEGDDVQRLPWGPVRADVVESAEFVFFYIGEHILHLHTQLFFKHRGVEKRFEGMTPAAGVVLAERVSGVGSVAHALAYCQAVEAAAGCVPPPRARQIRTLIAEMERLYNHLHYLGNLAEMTTLKVGGAEGKLLEERAKQLNARLSGSRFLRGLLLPGGVRSDIDPGDWLGPEIARLRAETAAYIDLLEGTGSYLDRLITTGVLEHAVALDQGATGPVARASGIDQDLRRDHVYAAYEAEDVTIPVRTTGDVQARFEVRVQEIDASFNLIERVLARLAPGPLLSPCVPAPRSEGLGWAESPRGVLLYAVHLDDFGRLARVKVKSPSFSNWRVFPFTVHDSNMMDYAINEASFGLTVAGCDR